MPSFFYILAHHMSSPHRQPFVWACLNAKVSSLLGLTIMLRNPPCVMYSINLCVLLSPQVQSTQVSSQSLYICCPFFMSLQLMHPKPSLSSHTCKVPHLIYLTRGNHAHLCATITPCVIALMGYATRYGIAPLYLYYQGSSIHLAHV